MAPQVQILPITGCSDGEMRRRPPGKAKFTRNDDYYLQHIATDRWIKDLPGGPQPGFTYRLDRLPEGYAGFERSRDKDPQHLDRYLYGHPNGAFRSLNELYPHFKWLMDHDTPHGCTCKRCAGGNKKPAGGFAQFGDRDSIASDEAAQTSSFSARPRTIIQPKAKRHQLEAPAPPRRRQVDEDGTPDIYRALLDKLKLAGPHGRVDESIVELNSPDWRAGHTMLLDLINDWKTLPNYVPRVGEIVMFVRNLGLSEILGWDDLAQSFHIFNQTDNKWGEKPRWEAGVVTQMPLEPLTEKDLENVPAGKQRSVIESGFRIEPLSCPSDVNKMYTKQHRYVPLHSIRPFALWEQCLRGLGESDWHPTIGHALKIANSFCLIAKSRFKGTWPNAFISAKGLYIGGESVLSGDAVYLQPRREGLSTDQVTDIMTVSTIKLVFVNLDEAGDDDRDEGRPYFTCLHVSGRVYTLDPTRSFGGVGMAPIDPNSGMLGADLLGLGQWYHVNDPEKAKSKMEIPYTRVLGRCMESTAIKVWFTLPKDVTPSSSSFQAINAENTTTSLTRYSPISHTLHGVLNARKYSQLHDSRIDVRAGKSWLWADTRIEQLDLHEVNGMSVGVKDDSRAKAQMEDWRKALKALDGNQRGLAEYHAARKAREHQAAQRESVLAASGSGIVAGGARVALEEARGPTDLDEDDGAQDAMEVDGELTSKRSLGETADDSGENEAAQTAA